MSDTELLSTTAVVRGPYKRRVGGIPGFVTEYEFADRLGIQIQTIRRWRRQRYGPQAVTVGKRIFYRENAAEIFAAEELARAEAGLRTRGRPRNER